MPRLFEGQPDEQALWATIRVSTDLLVIRGFDRADTALVRAIACDSTYRQVMSGSDEMTFTAFPETQSRLPHVYEKLTELGYTAIEERDRSIE